MDGWRGGFGFAQLCSYVAVGVNVDVGRDVFIMAPTMRAVILSFFIYQLSLLRFVC